jgi:hypothetical protein
MGTAVRPAKIPPGPWDAAADVDVFVDEVLASLDRLRLWRRLLDRLRGTWRRACVAAWQNSRNKKHIKADRQLAPNSWMPYLSR